MTGTTGAAGTPAAPACTDDCAAALRDRLAQLGADATVSHLPPLVANPYVDAMICPHGVTWWMEPTSEQRAAWARDGVR